MTLYYAFSLANIAGLISSVHLHVDNYYSTITMIVSGALKLMLGAIRAYMDKRLTAKNSLEIEIWQSEKIGSRAKHTANLFRLLIEFFLPLL